MLYKSVFWHMQLPTRLISISRMQLVGLDIRWWCSEIHMHNANVCCILLFAWGDFLNIFWVDKFLKCSNIKMGVKNLFAYVLRLLCFWSIWICRTSRKMAFDIIKPLYNSLKRLTSKNICGRLWMHLMQHILTQIFYLTFNLIRHVFVI